MNKQEYETLLMLLQHNMLPPETPAQSQIDRALFKAGYMARESGHKVKLENGRRVGYYMITKAGKLAIENYQQAHS